MSVTPEFIGQRYKDTNTGNIWIANSTTPGDWALEAYANAGMTWGPNPTDLEFVDLTVISSASETSYSFPTLTSIITGIYSDSLTNITSLTFPALLDVGDVVQIFGCTNLTQLDLSSLQFVGDGLYLYGCVKLTSVDLGSLVTAVDAIDIYDCTLLESIDLGVLVAIGADFNIYNDPALNSLILSELATVAGSITMVDNTSLAAFAAPSLISADNIYTQGSSVLSSVSLPLFVPSNGGSYEFRDGALNQSSVDHILARCVANPAFVTGIVRTDGGTSAAPGAQGLTDKATLIGRGVAVTTN